MTIVDPNADQDLLRLWSVIAELSEQLSRNRAISVSLYGQAGTIKSQAAHSQTGFVLRRYNLDKSQEEYDTELERMTAAVAAENQGLQHDNKQLNALIKEYEQTLENLMSAFRNRARDVQEKELALIREYETKLLSREEEDATQELAVSTSMSQSLARISHLLRMYMRVLGGEDTERPPTETTDDSSEPEEWTPADAADWALERECELSRLERENEMLRRMLGQPAGPSEAKRPQELTRSISSIPLHHGNGPMGGPQGRVGPYGTLKTLARAAG